MNIEVLRGISIAELFESIQGTEVQKRELYDKVTECCDSELDFNRMLQSWAKVSQLIHQDKTIASKPELGSKFQQFLETVIARSKSRDSYEFKNIKVKGDAAYFGVRLSLIKDLFTFWLQRPELFTEGNIPKHTFQALDNIIPKGEHNKYLMGLDAENISDRYLNGIVTASGYTYSSGVKCMLASVQLLDGIYYWKPKQYVGVQWCAITMDGLNILSTMLRYNPNDAEHYGAGLSYYKRMYDKI